MAIILIACVDIENGIGDANGELLFKLPKDMKHFKEITTNKHVVMGRATWESLPVRPLPKRKNYVLTSDESYEVQGRTKVLHEIGEILEMGKQKDVYIAGGGTLYQQMMDYADILLLTHVHIINRNATTFFPNLDVREWKITSHEKHESDKKHPHSFAFVRYERQMSRHERELMELKFLADQKKAEEEKDNQEN